MENAFYLSVSYRFVSQWSVERPSPILIQMMIAKIRDAGVLYGVIDWCLLMSFI